MNIHEYQAKEILKRFGIDVPRGGVVTSPEEAESVALFLGGTCVLKAQIHAGGRGKAGGIKRATDPFKAREIASQMIGMNLVTNQTGPKGRIVKKLLVEEALDVKKELYLGMVIDRSREIPVMIMSSEGGIDIEELSRKCPEKNYMEEIDISIGLQPYQARRLSLKCGLDPSLLGKASNLLTALSRVFFNLDCVIAEVNPLALTSDGRLLALDAKIVLDDNALFRHMDLNTLNDIEGGDIEEDDIREWEAKSKGLSYVGMSGTIGLMVNGAGLAMATMDIIKLFGGEPANFLDVGGSGSTDQVAHALKIILADKKVKVLLINIFGGIMRCDIIAQGVIDAAKDTKIDVPLVVRLKGTNVDLGIRLLKDSGLNIVLANGMTEAAKKAVKLAKE